MTDEEKKPEETKEEAKPISIVDEARAIRDEIVKAREDLKAENDRKEKIKSEELLGSTAGGHVETKQVSPEDQKKAGAKEFFKGTQLESAIDKL